MRRFPTWSRTASEPRRPAAPRTRLTVEQLERRDLLSGDATTPIMLSRDGLGLGYVTAMALSPDGHKVYLGRGNSFDPDRQNLGVLSLDAAGQPVGEPHFYADSVAPLPLAGAVYVQSIVVDAARHKLYVASDPRGSGWTDPRQLTVYDLDDAGELVGTPRSYDTGAARATSIALHPTLNRLYLVSKVSTAVYVYDLDAQGEPQGPPQSFPVGTFSPKYDVDVSADGSKLYLGSWAAAEIVDLDASGHPVVNSARSFATGADPNPIVIENIVNFEYTPQALYLTHSMPDTFDLGTPQPEPIPKIKPLEIWPLDAYGELVGTPQSLPAFRGRAVAIDPARDTLWIGADDTFTDAFTGLPQTDGTRAVAVSLDGAGFPIDGTETGASPTYSQNVLAVTVAADTGKPVVLTQGMPGILGNQVKDYHLQVTILAADPQEGVLPATIPVDFRQETASRPARHLGDLALNVPSDATSLDPDLKDVSGQMAFRLWVLGNVGSTDPSLLLDSLQVKLDVWQSDPNQGGTLLRSMTETVQGTIVSFVLPGYGFEPPGERSDEIELLSEHAQDYLEKARQVAVAPADRPEQFVVSASALWGGQGHLGQLQAQAEALALLGINTVGVTWWNGDYPTSDINGLTPQQIDAVLDSLGISRRSLATEVPLIPDTHQSSYFDFYLQDNPQLVTNIINYFTAYIGPTSGSTPADIVDFKMADEPFWIFPEILDIIRNNPNFLADFRGWLQAQGLQPSDFGQASWDGVLPLKAGAAADLPTRRLHYWTMRYLPESAARGLSVLAAALRQAFPNLRTVETNWAPSLGKWFYPAGTGSFDWLVSGRVGQFSPWAEDWFVDQEAQDWSVIGDVLRSSATLNGTEFGGYVVGRRLRNHPSGASYKILSLIGHGAKTVDLYAFGPELFAWGDAWSDRFEVYGHIADALEVVGRAERLLFPGRPERGEVAIALPHASSLWDDDNGLRHYEWEVRALHYALVHAGYTVDFVDDVDLAQGALGDRGYKALYVTGPNLSAAAQQQVKDWVEAGGTLVVTPGAAVADEYNTPSTILDSVLGVQPRQAVRAYMPALVTTATDTLTRTGADFRTGAMRLYGAIAPLTTAGATVEATLTSGTAAITTHSYGAGTAIADGFFPGWQYWVSPSRLSPFQLPRGWGETERHVAVAPARLADTPQPVILSQEVVEANRLESDHGIAIVLLNWTDQPITSLTVTVPNAGLFHTVRSAQGTQVQTRALGPDTVEITLSLTDVDVLLLERADVSPIAAILGIPGSVPEGAPIALLALGSDPGAVAGDAGVRYAWNVTKNGAAYAQGSGAGIHFTPDDNGLYLVSLVTIAWDGRVSSTFSQALNVTNVAPQVAGIRVPARAAVGKALTFSADVSDPGSADSLRYSWTVTRRGKKGKKVYARGSGSQFRFRPRADGVYQLTLTIADDDGETSTVTRMIRVGSRRR